MFSNYNYSKQEKKKRRPILGGVRMRKKYLKIFSLLIVGALTLYAGANEVKGACESGITVNFNSGNPTSVQSGVNGLLGTHMMTATATDGATYKAYCSWYENSTPQTGTYCLKKLNYDTGDATGIGLAYILNANTGYGAEPEKDQIIKTSAINLYLTIRGDTLGRTGCNTTDYRLDIDQNSWVYKTTTSNGFAKVTDGLFGNTAGEPMWQYASNMNTADSELFEDAWNKVFKYTYSSYSISSYPMQLPVHNLVKEAIRQANTYQTPTLKFTKDTENTDFEYDGGYYVKTYALESNFNYKLNSNTASINIAGYGTVNGSSQDVKVSFNDRDKTITVKIAESIVNANSLSLGKTKVTVTVKTNYEKAIVYALSEATNRCIVQDIVLVKTSDTGEDKSVETITASTDDVIEIKYKKCYQYKTDCDDTACDNTNSSNIRTCYSKVDEYKAITCDASDALNKASGKYTTTLKSGVCSLYCTESAKVYYPGNVRPAITIGTNLEWPTSASGDYPLQTLSTLTCTIEMDNGGAVTQECINLASQAKYVTGDNSAYVLYNDTKEDQRVDLKQDCSSTTSVNGSSVTITNSCFYTLENTYNTINKETLEFVKNESIVASEAVTNYILITQYGGRLPIMGIDWKDDDVYGDTLFANPYNLEIKNLSLGYNNEFTTKLNENAYVCNYKVTAGNDGSCVCPPGTEYSGYYLSGLIKDTAQTCADAKEIYCNNICDKNPELCVCPSGSDYPGKDITECLKESDYAACVTDKCYNTPPITCTKTDGSGEADITNCVKTNDIEYCKTLYGCKDSTKDIPCPPGSKYEDERNCNAWVNGGGTEADCIVNWCNDSSCTGDNCDPACPSGSDYEGMSISDCVSSERGAGKNLTEALNICQKYCYKSGTKGGNIIYRTISLENPFVGKDASTNLWSSGGLMNWMHQVSGVDPSIGLAVYRYPGANWNSPTLVKNKIWYNRGYKASAIYQEATPLYTINLDAKAIKEIRKYNEAEQSKGGYADFELECTDGAYCISSFLHDNIISTADPNLPFLDEQNSTCAKANDKSSFISCYTYK